MYRYLFKLIILIITLFSGCMRNQENNTQPLYQSESFTVYPDKVEQGDFKALAISDTELKANYQSPANQHFPRTITFKFSINGKDNENLPGKDHKLMLYPDENNEVSTPVIPFGGQYVDTTAMEEGDFLESDVTLHVRLDMRHVLEDFKEKGFYIFNSGEKIYKQDFKGVYIAGSPEPLSWDFENLAGMENLELKDEDGDGIFETTLLMNSSAKEQELSNHWQLKEDISQFPQYQSRHPLVNALYNLSLEELKLDVRPDSAFMAGAKWNGVWTRDISYSILLSLASIAPEVSKNSLMHKVKNGIIIQDTGTGGSWPVSSDRITWALAAWEIYQVSGDKEWLEHAYEIIRASAEADLKTVYDEETGLFMGESSFLDWRKQSYPRWMEPVDIYKSLNLGTNAVHYKTYDILSQMAKTLGKPSEKYRKVADHIKRGINKYLWMENKGYYGQYLYGRTYLSLSERSEALGEALCVLFDIADNEQQKRILANTPVVEYGIPCIYPQIPGIPPYHNNGIWPFVQAYWNLAAAKGDNEKVLLHGLGSIYRASGLFLTNKENMVAESGDFKGTEINSDRQLWSVAGNLAMVYKVFFGMDFQPDQLTFQPFVPKPYGGTKTLTGFKYRDALLDISIEGHGSIIKTFTMDGKVSDPEIPGDMKGRHSITIELTPESSGSSDVNLVDNKFTPETPIVSKKENSLVWQKDERADRYEVYGNGEALATTTHNYIEIKAMGKFTAYQVRALSSDSLYSFLSEPVTIIAGDISDKWEAEKFAERANYNYSGYSGNGFIALSRETNREVTIPVHIDKSGKYELRFKYANGSGPVNTDNKCGIRSLYLDGALKGTAVFPQRGTDEWSNWGYSNHMLLVLEKGQHTVTLRYDDFNKNMNVDVNRFMLDHLEIIALDD